MLKSLTDILFTLSTRQLNCPLQNLEHSEAPTLLEQAMPFPASDRVAFRAWTMPRYAQGPKAALQPSIGKALLPCRMKKGTDGRSTVLEIGLGYNNALRIIEFEDGIRWIGRTCPASMAASWWRCHWMESECCTALLAQQRNNGRYA